MVVKKYLVPLLISVVLVSLVATGYQYRFMLKNKISGLMNRNSSNISYDTSVVDNKAVNVSCDTQGTIEYMYYAAPSGKSANNKFGLYVYAEDKKFLELAQNLVNSNGGDWGYVLIPYNIHDQDSEKWKGVFDTLLDKHLIPIVQLWGIDTGKYKKQTQEAAAFLDTFVWPVRQRYISVYNEPNDSKFWDGSVDPKEYAQVLSYTIAIFKAQNPDYFMINGALNASASDSNNTMDAEKYMKLMNESVPGIFNQLDGWASHSYPQPNFAGSPDGDGRWSIKAYQYELKFLKNDLGVRKDLPVFITETGWAHAEGENYNASYLTDDEVGENLEKAYEKIWLPDDRIIAVTPFTVWYDPPFDHFSWVNKDKVPYKHYDVIKAMKKVKGKPEKLEKAVIPSLGCK